MFTTYKKDSQPVWNKATAAAPKLRPHYPVLSAKELLKGPSYAQILGQLKSLAFVPDGIFNDLYLKAIQEYAEFVQGLPATQVDHFNYHGGLLELGLKRALQTLAWYRREHPIKGFTVDQVPTRQAIWSYALFTAGLVYGLGQIVATYYVMICREDGFSLQRWNPITSKMSQQGSFYRYSYEPMRRDDLAARSTPLLAQQILPNAGVSWIATDTDIFNAWLSILLNDDAHAGIFAKYILPVHTDLEQQTNPDPGCIIGTEIEEYYIDDLPLDETKTVTLEKTESPTLFAVPSEKDAMPGKNDHLVSSGMIANTGIIFIQWLMYSQKERNLLGQKSIVNENGLVVTPDLVERFAKERGESPEKIWTVLTKELATIRNMRMETSALTKQTQRIILIDPTLIAGKILVNREVRLHGSHTNYPNPATTAPDNQASATLSAALTPGKK